VRSENDHLRFECRIGHVYSLLELIVSKEKDLEDALWAPVTALDELATLLRDAVAAGQAGGSREGDEARAARALAPAEVLRQLIMENEPIPLNRPSKAPADEP